MDRIGLPTELIAPLSQCCFLMIGKVLENEGFLQEGLRIKRLLEQAQCKAPPCFGSIIAAYPGRNQTLTPKEAANGPRPPAKPWPTALNFQSAPTR